MLGFKFLGQKIFLEPNFFTSLGTGISCTSTDAQDSSTGQAEQLWEQCRCILCSVSNFFHQKNVGTYYQPACLWGRKGGLDGPPKVINHYYQTDSKTVDFSDDLIIDGKY